MKPVELRERTKRLSLRIIKMVAALPRNRVGEILGRQVLRSGTSIGANYREALRASSRKQFAYTLDLVCRETDETLYWLELIVESGTLKPSLMSGLLKEGSELLAIFTATARTTKQNTRRARPNAPKS